MKGYRTIVINVLALLFSVLAMTGLEIAPDVQGTISAGILAIINIFMRTISDTPVGQSKPLPETPTSNSQSGFVRLPVLGLLAILSLAAVLPGCSLFQNKNPIVDCANVVELSNNTIGACYASIEIVADSIDAAADAALITKDKENEYLSKLENAVAFLTQTQMLMNNDVQTATDRLKAAQSILTILSNEVPKLE